MVNNNNNNNNNNQNLPQGFKEDRDVVTKVTTLGKLIEDKLIALKDLATLEVLMPVTVRMKERLKSIHEMSSAKHLKIRGHWKTTSPQMHITKLKAQKISNNEAEITFSVYETDKNGNKSVTEQKTEVTLANGDKVERVSSADYKIKYEVRETIRTGKAIEREIMEISR